MEDNLHLCCRVAAAVYKKRCLICIRLSRSSTGIGFSDKNSLFLQLFLDYFCLMTAAHFLKPVQWLLLFRQLSDAGKVMIVVLGDKQEQVD